MRLICLSDTHGKHRQLSVPDGDILIHAGDFTVSGQAEQIQDFNAWLGELPHRHKVVIAGNHDFLFEREPELARQLLSQAHYLQDSGLTVDGVRFWGSPVSPRFFDWAFNRQRGAEIAQHWQQIPVDTQILIVHTPAYGILDQIGSGQSVGCEDLRLALEQHVQPDLFICGHIHESRGIRRLAKTVCLNAAVLNRYYQPEHPVWELDYDPQTGSVSWPESLV